MVKIKENDKKNHTTIDDTNINEPALFIKEINFSITSFNTYLKPGTL